MHYLSGNGVDVDSRLTALCCNYVGLLLVLHEAPTLEGCLVSHRWIQFFVPDWCMYVMLIHLETVQDYSVVKQMRIGDSLMGIVSSICNSKSGLTVYLPCPPSFF